MTARILTPTEPYDRHPAIIEGGELLRVGELVAFPTETVYGLGADATNPAAVEKIYEAKQRPGDNPSIVHVGHNADLLEIAVVEDSRIVALFKRFWPGALTMVLPALEPYKSTVGRGLDTVAVRMPGHPIALALIHAAGVPLAAPSANRSGRPSPTTAQHVFDDLGEVIPLILDGGPCMVGIESTVIDLSGEEAVILRPGVISASEISDVLGQPVRYAIPDDQKGHSPGTRHPHYQPRARVVLLERGISQSALAREIEMHVTTAPGGIGAILTSERALPAFPVPMTIRLARHTDALERNLYAYLRELDALGVGVILVESVDEGEAVMDRLRRAAERG